MKSLLLPLLLSLILQTNANVVQKKGKSFSIFSVVQFQNSQCTSTMTFGTTNMQGTCYTASECQSNGGTSSGNCASGFGVCCVFVVSTCGSTISKNVTYIQNPSFPSAFTTTGTCQYTLGSTSDICQLRLDFDKLVLGDPDANGVCPAGDRMTIVSASGSGPNASPPITCGTLTGSHMYVETARSSTMGGTLTIANSGTAASVPARSWKIKVTQIECGSSALAPTDCLQFLTGPGGSFTSFNYKSGTGGTLLTNLNYKTCIRQEEGFCSVQFSSIPTAAGASGFFLDGTATSVRQCPAGTPSASVTIPSTSIAATETYCGQILNSLAGQTVPGTVEGTLTPFEVGVFTTGNQVANSGFNLMYSQVPC